MDEFTDHLTLLYVIAPDIDGPTKIGISANIKNRVEQLQIGCWLPLKVYGVRFATKRVFVNANCLEGVAKESARALEAACHKNLRACDVGLNGEWFDITPKEALEAISVTGKKEGIAAVSLADAAGIEVSKRNRTESDAYDHFMGALTQANQFIANQLDDNAKGGILI